MFQMHYELCPHVVHALSPAFAEVIGMLPVVVVHGGAGSVPKERAMQSKAGVCAAARSGYAILQSGGSSMDAVVEAVTKLENNPSFNAGEETAFCCILVSVFRFPLGHRRL